MRDEFAVDQLDPGRVYTLLTASIVPRPIAWVSTLSAEGVPNLAPHSFFTVASVNPAVVQFTSVGRKDSLNNVEATGEFVLNLTPLGLIEQVNATGTNYPPHIDEFDATALPREPSVTVKPYRVASSPVVIECTLERTVDFGHSVVVMGTVRHIAVDQAVMAPDGLPDIEALAPVARLGRNEWSLLGEVRRIDRIPYDG